MNMEITILGCGPSAGVPRLNGEWGQCDPNEPRNRRLRASISFCLPNGELWLIDTSPDLRQQCLKNHIQNISGVLFTHAHYDHIGGLEDLFHFLNPSSPIKIYSDPQTLQILFERIETTLLKPFNYKAYLDILEIEGPFEVGGQNVIPFLQTHGTITSLGFRFPSWAYSTDVNALSEDALTILKGVHTWIVDCLDLEPRPTHAHLDLVLQWVERIQPSRVILTHMSSRIDYNTLSKMLPKHIELAYDGMKILCQ
jgi:phosphoribosyl 1,2-cyclic phosphate phosphodiesterase